MGRVQTLKPRVAMASVVRAQPLTTATVRMTGRRLQKRNRRYLSEHPLCAKCEEQGRVAAAVEVDHKIPLHLGGPDDESNLQSLCVPCHEAKSEAERVARECGGAP